MTRRALPIAVDRLAQRLDELTIAGTLAHAERGESVRCVACAHRCRLQPGQRGVCGVRVNEGGVLRVPWGYVARRYVRPVETNTIFHVHPGALALTFGMYGCDLRCPYCHNYYLSQALREPVDEMPIPTTPRELVDEAILAGASVVCAAYNEPLIAAEWTHDVFAEAHRRGLTTALITDGHSTQEALEHMRPVTDVVRVDLKAFDDRGYRALGGRIAPVIETIERAKALGFWVEVVTLVVPGLNDDIAGLRGLASTLANLDPDMPWHINAAQPRYKHHAAPPEADLLSSAAGAAHQRGLRYVYVGNAPTLGSLAHTRCPSCAALVIERADYRTLSNTLDGGRCHGCRAPLSGLWGHETALAATG